MHNISNYENNVDRYFNIFQKIMFPLNQQNWMILVQNVGKSMPIKRIFYIEDLNKSSKMSLAPHVVKFLSQKIG